jgi:hypothetical protein
LEAIIEKINRGRAEPSKLISSSDSTSLKHAAESL